MYPDPVTIVHTGRPGRPRKEIDLQYLACKNDPTVRLQRRKTVKSLGISDCTLLHRLWENNLDFKFSIITDDRLDTLVRQYRRENPSSGVGYLIRHLREHHKLRIQGNHLLESIKRVDGLGRRLRTHQNKPLRRRHYKVKKCSMAY